jgi:hypothetical protein
MALTDNGNGLSAADVAAVVGNGSGGFGNWADGSFWIIILFLFAFMGNGWGGFGGNAGMMPYVMSNTTNSDVQRGFDQQAVIGGINGLTASINALAQGQCNGFNGVTQAVNNGFYGAEIANNSRQMGLMQQLNAMQMAQQNCCCENRAAVADLKYTVATEACNDRAAVNDALNTLTNVINAGFTGIHNELCQDRLEAKDLRIRELENQLNVAAFNNSQVAQTAQLEAFIRANQTTPATTTAG